ncbi:MAG TPA: hypothetical protein VIF60_16105 [Burkholderiaceae bacterium]|jgi:hypothetical protein
MSSEIQTESMLSPFTMVQWWQKQMQSFMPIGILDEPILPNGTFAGIVINEQNSTDPQTERHIVNQVSYGKQIGWLVDAVDVLIAERTAKAPKAQDQAKLKQLRDLKKEIDGLKNQVAQSRFERVKSELARLAPDELADCRQQINVLLAQQGK